MRSFSELPLAQAIRQAVAAEGYQTPTPIQVQSIPSLVQGRDLLGCAQTGTGKTAAFALPILHRLGVTPTRDQARSIRALVLTPTRELAAQILESFRVYGQYVPVRTDAIYGGVSKERQVCALRQGIDVLVATPGRLLELMDLGHVDLRHLETFVLDEADRMLDMGFIHDVRRVIAALPAKRQSLFFSATMPKAVSQLAGTLLTNPVKVELMPEPTSVDRIRQSVFFVDRQCKDALLESILTDARCIRVLVFTRTKRRASRVARKLSALRISCDAIHGDKPQAARTRALQCFRQGRVRVLVATDIAARGIDVDDITHVINYELPNEPESYVHRIGRTARAGKDGDAISFCSGDERDHLRAIERSLRLDIRVVRTHVCHSESAEQGVTDHGRECGRQQPARRERAGPGHGKVRHRRSRAGTGTRKSRQT